MHLFRHRSPHRRWADAAGLLLAVLLASSSAAHGATPLPASAQAAIEQLLSSQTSDLPGQIAIRIEPLAAALPPCAAPQAFLPDGMRAWGRVSVGLHCPDAPSWTRFVPAYVAVIGRYYVAAQPIAAGQRLRLADAEARDGDLTRLPAGVINDAAQCDGMVATNRIAAGAPLRRELLRGATVLRQGQNVKVLAQGPGFVVSGEGRAMTSAAVGATLQVKMQGGQLISGTVRADGQVERSQ